MLLVRVLWVVAGRKFKNGFIGLEFRYVRNLDLACGSWSGGGWCWNKFDSCAGYKYFLFCKFINRLESETRQ